MASIALKVLAHSVRLAELSGDFDLTNGAEVEQVLDEVLLDEECRVLAVDLSGVSFLDSTMLNALVVERDRAQLLHKPVWLVRPRPEVWRVFEVTMLDRLFRAFDSISELREYVTRTAGRLHA